MSQHYLLYGHGGAFNHGGEALVKTTIALLRRLSPGCRITLSTHFAWQDRLFGIDADEFVERDSRGKTNEECYAPTLKRITGESICIHLGGDNYCYQNWQRYAAIHYKALECGAVSILWSCSVDPEKLGTEKLEALRTHHLITARETITYDALRSEGLANVVKVSDIAFTLEPEPVGFGMRNFVALNLSPLVAGKNPFVKPAFQQLVDYLIEKTDLNVAFVPHVMASVDNDNDILHQLTIRDKKRVAIISDQMSAAQYKYIISKARLGVFARTHAAIAAYSSLVPSLAIAYSAKARGIAVDLGMTEYLLEVEKVSGEQDLVNSFQNLQKNENAIQARLTKRIPQYIRSAQPDNVLEFLKRGKNSDGENLYTNLCV